MPEIQVVSDTAELDRLFSSSSEQPVWLFKHSLICPVSTEALRQFQSFVSDAPSAPSAFGLIEIQRARDLSSAVAERTGVRHESPQALLIRDGRAVWSASHWSITRDALQGVHESAPTEASAG